MRIFLIRHGETAWNVGDKRFRGQTDVELSTNGLTQAECAGKALKNEKIEAIYYGPLSRTKLTAEKIRKYLPKANFIKEPLLIDISFGDWEGKTHKEIFQNFPGTENLWNNQPEKLVFPNGESWFDVFKRVNDLFNLMRKGKYKTIILVSHRVVLNIILLYLLKLDLSHFWDFEIDTASITELNLDENDNLRIKRTNDTDHLK